MGANKGSCPSCRVTESTFEGDCTAPSKGRHRSMVIVHTRMFILQSVPHAASHQDNAVTFAAVLVEWFENHVRPQKLRPPEPTGQNLEVDGTNHEAPVASSVGVKCALRPTLTELQKRPRLKSRSIIVVSIMKR